MDPLSIAGSVLSLTATCVKAAKALNNIRDAWQRAPVTVSSLCSPLKVTAASLSQIQSLLLNDTDILQVKPELIETFDTTLTSCLVLSTWLESIMQKITKGVLDETKAPWKMKFKTLIRRHEHLLQEIANNTQSIRRTHSIEAPESILGTDEASGSIFSKLIEGHGSGDQTLEDSFESVILTTKVYSNAFTSALSRAPRDEVDDAGTIANVGLGSDEVQPLTDWNTISPRPTLPIQQFLDHPPHFNTVINDLKFNVNGTARVNRKALHPGEPSLAKDMTIYAIRKINDCWYWGHKVSPSYGRPKEEGSFMRGNVVFTFHSRKTVLVRIRRASPVNLLNGYNLQYGKDEIFEASCFAHMGTLFVRKQASPKPMSLRHAPQTRTCVVSMDDVEFVDSSVVKDIDALLEFFSCPHPARIGAFEEELEYRAEEWSHHHDDERHGWDQLFAHCASFAELQAVSRAFHKFYHRYALN